MFEKLQVLERISFLTVGLRWNASKMKFNGKVEVSSKMKEKLAIVEFKCPDCNSAFGQIAISKLECWKKNLFKRLVQKRSFSKSCSEKNL